jgi:hypothetical protein
MITVYSRALEAPCFICPLIGGNFEYNHAWTRRCGQYGITLERKEPVVPVGEILWAASQCGLFLGARCL